MAETGTGSGSARSAASRARPKATPGIQCFKCDKRCRNAGHFRSATTPGAALVLVLAFALIRGRLPPGLTCFSLKRRLAGHLFLAGSERCVPGFRLSRLLFQSGRPWPKTFRLAVQKAIAENRRVCKTVAIEKGFITRKDINGDGRPDFVLDYESFICDGNRGRFAARLDV